MLRCGHIGRRIVAAVSVGCAVLAFAGLAAAATAPTAITGPVTTVGATSADVSGTVNPNGSATTYQFEYGKTTTYGTSTAATNAGSGAGNIGVSATFTGLSAGTSYHYRVVATSTAGGTTNGADGIFTTSGGPAVVTAPASSVGTGTATLNGSVNPNGRATAYFFEYGKTTAYGSKTPVANAGSGTAPTNVSAAVSGLSAGQVYHFRLDATSDTGTVQGADMSFTPSGGPGVTTKAATSITSSSARLNGTVNPNGLSTTYYFDYGTSTNYGSRTAVATAGAGTANKSVSATITGLGPGAYHFRLVATSSAGTSTGSDLTFGSAGPPAVQTGSAQGASTTGVTLTGSVNPGGNTTTWYFEYGTSTSYSSKTPAKSAGSGSAPTGVSAAIAKLTAGTTYHYRLVATSSAGTVNGSDVTFTTVAALTLTASTAQAVYGTIVTLSGAVWSRQTGVKITIYGQAIGSRSFSTLGSSLTGAGGTWSFPVRPKLQTAYRASASDGTSATATIGVRPAVSLRVITGARFSTRVVAGSSFARKTVQLQRLLPGNRWKTLAKAKLNSKSSAVFSAKVLPKGTSLIRVAMSVNQAGKGYLGAFSRTATYHR
ncbi:MAG TPA: fibronectin type III domain-containing protein [Gaiellaceae bacterium]|jgi:hypothetical protein|nr:fibronectin type III domain-containing protein [Gaiellaceae bacterium]